MRILTFTSLFPNSLFPNSSIFIKNRMVEVNSIKGCEIKVVSPVPWFPRLVSGKSRWNKIAKIEHYGEIEGLKVYYPRYFVTPKIGMSLYGYYMFLGSYMTVRNIYQKWPFDLIDAHYVYPDGLAAVLLGKMLKVPVVVSARGTDINLYPCFGLIRPLIRRVLNRSDRLISVCQSLADILVAHGPKPQKIAVIPNGIDPCLFRNIDKMTARQRLGFDQKAKILISVGSLIERKGHHLLIEALAQMKKCRTLNFLTLIIGQGPDFHKLKRQIHKGGLEDIVRLVGEVNNSALPDWYCAADLFFLGSSREGWPNVVSEALACGTPVVATAVNGIPEIIVSEKYGMVIDRNPQAFADGIQRAFSKVWDREQISKHGKQRTWQVVADEVYAVFKGLLNESAGNER